MTTTTTAKTVFVPASVLPAVPAGCEAPVLGTHDGAFHCDDVCAIALLLQLAEFRNSPVVRSRKEETLSQCRVVVDVGGSYDPEKNRLDHHQRGFDEKFPGRTATKMSSVGLVWLHFGKRVLAEAWGVTDAEVADVVHRKFYERCVESIDALDNGVNICEGEPRFIIRTDLTSRIARLNLEWNDPTVDMVCAEQFTQAVRMAGEELNAHLHKIVNVWLPARVLVRQALDGRNAVHPSGRVIELAQGCPWEEHLFELEQELGIVPSADDAEDNKRPADGSILFVIHKGYAGDWRVRAVRKSLTTFGNRLDLAARFRGLRDEELAKHPDGEGINFVHAGGFLGGCKTREAALRLVALSMEQ